MKTLLPILLALSLAGCRTAGPRILITDCPGARIHIPGEIDAAQGKTVDAGNPLMSAAPQVNSPNSTAKSGDVSASRGNPPVVAPSPAPEEAPAEEVAEDTAEDAAPDAE